MAVGAVPVLLVGVLSFRRSRFALPAGFFVAHAAGLFVYVNAFPGPVPAPRDVIAPGSLGPGLSLARAGLIVNFVLLVLHATLLSPRPGSTAA